MTSEQKNIILKIIKDNISTPDYDIARNPVVKKCFRNLKFDTVRRSINLLRQEYNLHNPDRNNKKNISKDIPIYLRKFKNRPIHEIAGLLKLKYPFYKFDTIRVYVQRYVHWGEN